MEPSYNIQAHSILQKLGKIANFDTKPLIRVSEKSHAIDVEVQQVSKSLFASINIWSRSTSTLNELPNVVSWATKIIATEEISPQDVEEIREAIQGLHHLKLLEDKSQFSFIDKALQDLFNLQIALKKPKSDVDQSTEKTLSDSDFALDDEWELVTIEPDAAESPNVPESKVSAYQQKINDAYKKGWDLITWMISTKPSTAPTEEKEAMDIICKIQEAIGSGFPLTEKQILLLERMFINYPKIRDASSTYISEGLKAKSISLKILENDDGCLVSFSSDHLKKLMVVYGELMRSTNQVIIDGFTDDAIAFVSLFTGLNEMFMLPNTQFQNEEFISETFDPKIFFDLNRINERKEALILPVHYRTFQNVFKRELQFQNKLKEIADLISETNPRMEFSLLNNEFVSNTNSTNVLMKGILYYRQQNENNLTILRQMLSEGSVPELAAKMLSDLEAIQGYESHGSAFKTLTKVGWKDITKNATQSFVSGTRVVSLVTVGNSRKDIEVPLDLSPLGVLNQMQCKQVMETILEFDHILPVDSQMAWLVEFKKAEKNNALKGIAQTLPPKAKEAIQKLEFLTDEQKDILTAIGANFTYYINKEMLKGFLTLGQD